MNKVTFSFALEGSYWHHNFNYNKHDNLFSLNAPKSIDFGMEWGKGVTRIYSEFQIGQTVTGISAGIVSEFKNSSVSLGFQSSIWANYIGGLDLRYRRIDNHNFFCPGIYAKWPFVITGNWVGD
jgi:hypothetical protein